MKNKKGNVFTISITLAFFFLLASIIFLSGYVLFTMGNDYIAVPMNNISTQANYSPEIIAAFDTIGNDYHNTNLVFFDYSFLVAFIIITGIGLFGAYRTRALNYFTWLLGLLYGQMILLFVLGTSLLYTNWILDLIVLVMPNLDIQLPIMYYIIERAGIIFLGLSCIYFLVNIIDFDFATIINRKKKEQDILKDEIL